VSTSIPGNHLLFWAVVFLIWREYLINEKRKERRREKGRGKKKRGKREGERSNRVSMPGADNAFVLWSQKSNSNKGAPLRISH